MPSEVGLNARWRSRPGVTGLEMVILMGELILAAIRWTQRLPTTL